MPLPDADSEGANVTPLYKAPESAIGTARVGEWGLSVPDDSQERITAVEPNGIFVSQGIIARRSTP